MKTVTLSGLGAYRVQANPKMAFGVLPWAWCAWRPQVLEQPWSLASAPCGPTPSSSPGPAVLGGQVWVGTALPSCRSGPARPVLHAPE